MQKGLAFLILALAAALCPVREAVAQTLPSWSDDAQKTWWAANPAPDLRPKAADVLQGQLEATYKQNGLRVFSDADFQSWLDQLEWVRLGLACPGVLGNPANLKTFIALGQDSTVSHLFVEKLDPLDIKEKALENLLRLAGANAADLHEYAALGVAFSLVFDAGLSQRLASFGRWTGALSRSATSTLSSGSISTCSPTATRSWNRDVTQLSLRLSIPRRPPGELVGATYAQQNRISYSHFADAFFAIRYDTNRIGNAAAVYNWPYPSYKLADIEKNGGICIDQAYYAENPRQGRGIPTIRFMGFGLDGAHAWLATVQLGQVGARLWPLRGAGFSQGVRGRSADLEHIDDSVLENLFKNGPDQHQLSTRHDRAGLGAFARKRRLLLPHSRRCPFHYAGVVRGLEIAGRTRREERRPRQNEGVLPGLDQSVWQLSRNESRRAEAALSCPEGCGTIPAADDLLKDIIIQNRTEGFDLGIQGHRCDQ